MLLSPSLERAAPDAHAAPPEALDAVALLDLPHDLVGERARHAEQVHHVVYGQCRIVDDEGPLAHRGTTR